MSRERVPHVHIHVHCEQVPALPTVQAQASLGMY